MTVLHLVKLKPSHMNKESSMFNIACFLLASTYFASAEIFTAIADVEYLLETHKTIIDDLHSYIESEKIRLAQLERNLKLYQHEHEKAMEDIPNYLGNPINAFTLIKRLTIDLDTIEDGIQKGSAYIKNITMTHPDLKYPASEDLAGAAQALIRLKDTYKLNVSELAEGKLNGFVYSTPMSTDDCYELGRTLYNERDVKNALPWFKEALTKYRNGDQGYSFNEVDILEYIAFSYYIDDDPQSALEWTLELLVVEPSHERARGNIPHYNKSITEKKLRLQLKGEMGDSTPPAPQSKPTLLPTAERIMYERLCRGEMQIDNKIAKRLFCWYSSKHHPFLKLAPIKVEQVYVEPDVFIFHQVISDTEIQHAKDLARPRFKRASVHDPLTGKLVPAHYRISKSSWLKDDESPIVAHITQRIADMTGLSMDTAEELQVVNYGIGGHYEPHYDFGRKKENAFQSYPGNRIATVLFYMSEVAQGGATVFTELGLSVFPVKNAALYWLNLHPSGEGDLSTRHAACPVLRGSKWVSNKWIHQGGQELIRPCTLNFQEESMVRPIPKPLPRTFR